MSLSVSSFFNSKMLSTNPSSFVEKFTFANSDISGFVLEKGYGTIRRKTSDVVGGNTTLKVENASQTFNSLISDKTQFFKEGTYEVGFATESATNETLQLFGGVLTTAKFEDTKVSLSFEDKLSRLKDRFIGTDDDPVSFTNTEVNPADLAWWVVTSYGGMSTVKSTSNPDISYTQWFDWWTIFNDNSIVVNAHYTGEDVPEALQSMQKLLDSVVYAEGDNKLYFNRWTGAGSDTITITNSHLLNKPVTMEIVGTNLTNKVRVLHGFDPTSETWTGNVTFQDSTSVNTYGLHEFVYDDETVWYANSASAFNLAERVAFRKAVPNITLKCTVPLMALNAQLGDEVAVTTQVYSLENRGFNLEGYTISTQKKEITLELDEGFNRSGGRLHGFILDDAYWGLLDQSYNSLT